VTDHYGGFGNENNFCKYDALRVREFLAKKSITKMDNPPYSPDLAPCDFWHFQNLKKMPCWDKGLLTFLTFNTT
jgi:hypothetical protein